MHTSTRKGCLAKSSTDQGKISSDLSEHSAVESETVVVPVSPDATMRGNRDNAVNAVRALTSPGRLASVRREVVRRIEAEVPPESSDLPASTGREVRDATGRPQGRQRETFLEVRAIVKEVLHDHGLGLRYVRLLLQQYGSDAAADVSK